MKMNKAIAALVSGAAAVFGMALSARALDTPVVATLGFTDSMWGAQDWETSVEVTGDGTYTLTTEAVAGAKDFAVFVIDLNGMFADYPEASATLDKVVIDGSEISVAADKVLYGDLEEKGNFRINVYNMYTDDENNLAVNPETAVSEYLSVTFTVTGLDADPANTEEISAGAPAPAINGTDETTAPATGNASAASAAAIMALSGAAAVASKKRN